MESELEEERKQRAAAVSGKKKLEGELANMLGQVEMATKVKEDSLKQLRKLQVCRGRTQKVMLLHFVQWQDVEQYLSSDWGTVWGGG